MNPPPGFEPPPAPSRLGRLIPTMRGMLAGGSIVAISLYFATQFLPDGWRPGEVAGRMAGDAERAEINGKKQAQTELAWMMGNAAAQPQAKGAVDVALTTAVIEARTQSLAPVNNIAAVSDAVCMGAKMVMGLGAQTIGRDWQSAARTTAEMTCGLGDTIRPMVTQSQIEAATTAASARGMPLTNGAVSPHAPQQVAQAPITTVQATASRTKPTAYDLLKVMTISQASQHYDAATLADAEKVALQVPAEIRAHLRDGVAATNDDVFVERVAGLLRLAQALRD